MPPGFLVALHTPSNTGYAIAPLERVFYRVARKLTDSDDDVHFAYKSLERGRPETLPAGFDHVIACDLRSRAPATSRRLEEYVRDHGILTVLAFDAPVRLATYPALRRGGVSTLVSYQGAPMSSLNRGPKLWLKRLEVVLRRHGPDHYIFESEAMRETAVRGRGIPAAHTTVVPLGVDVTRFRRRDDGYARAVFSIPADRRIVAYSGHMEPRKGVDVIVKAAVELTERRGRDDVHFLLFGNRNGEERRFEPLYRGTRAEAHVTFGGYRDDLDRVFASSDVGCIASTGWDSFTMSSVEMAASGLPLVVSALQGLRETIEEETTGLSFPPGDHAALADRLERLLDDPRLRERMGAAARERVAGGYTVERQVDAIARAVDRVRAAS